MGNQVFLQSCIFSDMVGDAVIEECYGFRIFDDEGKDYDNNFVKANWDKIREKGPEEILKYFIDYGSSEGQAIAEFALFTKRWLYYDGEYVQLPGFEEAVAAKSEKDEEEIQ